jgi:hypothetical protein
MSTGGVGEVIAESVPPQRPYTVAKLAKEEGISGQCLRVAIKEGRIHAYRYAPRGQWLIPPEEVARIRRGEEGALADAD